ncbi:MAG: hypothetical protein IJ302_10495 [Clostridia bacterium]|nr:hypothetical protein [Clostridia bacterium]
MENTRHDTLEELHAQVVRYSRLKTQLELLKERLPPLEEEASRLNDLRLSEQEDVDRLESRTLSAWFYTVIGQLENKLTKEQTEALAARVRYEAAAAARDTVKDEIRQKTEELYSLSGCEARYRAAMEARTAEIKANNGTAAEQLLQLEQILSLLDAQKTEINEAITEGEYAYSAADSVCESLSQAEDLGQWDVFGGGMLVDMAKHDCIDEAQDHIDTLQVQLRRFHTELADVTLHESISIDIDSFDRTADFWFDGLFCDLSILDKITAALHQAQSVRSRIREVLDLLEEKAARTEAKYTEISDARDALIRRA